MKILKPIIILTLLATITSCASRVKFPTSSAVPAAIIKAKKSTDKQHNFTLQIDIKNLASVDRLDPPGNNYSVWIVTTEHGIKNIGRLNVKNAQKTTFEAETPFDFTEIFITVEDSGGLEYPSGQEIARTKI